MSGGQFVGLPATYPLTPDGYAANIAAVFGGTKAASIAAQYPLASYPSPDVAFETLVGDANFACPALQMDRWTSPHPNSCSHPRNRCIEVNPAGEDFWSPGQMDGLHR